MNQCMKGHPASNEPARQIGIWIRVSTEDQAKGESPQHHEERARLYAKAKGWAVCEVYDLAGVSGKSVMLHPEAKRMLNDIRRGHITGLIFSKLARLARNTKELLDFSDIFRVNNADLISLQESIDTSSPAGRLFYTMIAAMAQWEREEIAERVKASIPIRAKLGKPLGGNPPFGFVWKDKKLIQNLQEAPIRRLAYELFLKHRRKLPVANELNKLGHRTRAGKLWRDVTIGRTLRCPSAKGVYYLNRTRQTGNWTWEEKPKEEWGVLEIEPIVSEELWTQCNQILDEYEENKRPPGKKPVHLFAGLTHCACGQKMYVKQGSPKYVCQKCLRKIPIVDLDAIILEDLQAYFAAPERIAEHLTAANENVQAKEALLKSQQDEIQKIRTDMTRTHQLYVDGHITAQGFGEFYKPAEERLNQLVAELPALQAELDFLKVNTLSAEEVVSEASELYSRWPTLPIERRRSIVESIIERITIGEKEIELKLSYMPSSEELVKNQQALPRPSTRVRRR
jgi:site-specific DNA recombinase